MYLTELIYKKLHCSVIHNSLKGNSAQILTVEWTKYFAIFCALNTMKH